MLQIAERRSQALQIVHFPLSMPVAYWLHPAMCWCINCVCSNLMLVRVAKSWSAHVPAATALSGAFQCWLYYATTLHWLQSARGGMCSRELYFYLWYLSCYKPSRHHVYASIIWKKVFEKIFLSFSHTRQYKNHTSATLILPKFCDEITLDQRGVRLPHLEYNKFNAVSTGILNTNF